MEKSYYINLVENLNGCDDKQRAEIINKLSRDYNNAMPLLWTEALNQENPRAILSVIRDIIKKERPKGIFLRAMGNSKNLLGDFLQHSDPKVRKNVCGIISEIADPIYLEALYRAYSEEEQLFVKSAYVMAIGNCGGILDAEKLKAVFEKLVAEEEAYEDKSQLKKDEKHINEEKRALTKAIVKLLPPKPHEFKGFEKPVNMLLTAMDGQFETTLKELNEKSIKGNLVTEGVSIKEKDLNKVYSCRTFYELLFPLEACKDLTLDYKKIAATMIKSDIVGFLQQCHGGDTDSPFWYRVEFKTTDFSEDRSEFIKNLAGELDRISGGSLKNSPSSYEIEIRIVEKNNLFNVYIKLYTLKDTRFDYREKHVAASINPVTAAIALKAISPWLKSDARVIDPFCGVATMLIERAKVNGYKELVGIDKYNMGITYASMNSYLADVDVELISQDILDFQCEDLFDELICNMPFESKSGTGIFDTSLYYKFVDMIPSTIKSGGMAFLYTVEKGLLKQALATNSQLEIVDTIKIKAGGLTPNIFVIKVK